VADAPKRSTLKLTWLDRLVSFRQREAAPPGAKVAAYSATVPGGVLHVFVVEMPTPPGAPPGSGALLMRVAHTRTASPVEGAALVPTGKGRLVTLAELDAVVEHFAGGRLMALMLDGHGLPIGAPMFWELVQIAGLAVAGPAT